MDNGTWIGVGVLGTLAVGVGAIAIVRSRETATVTTGASQIDTSTTTQARTSTKAQARTTTQARTSAKAHVTRTPYYTVIRSGDTLSGIAFADGTTVDELVTLNAIADPNSIPIGTRIYLPKVMPESNLGINKTTVTCHDVRETIGDRLMTFRVCSDGTKTLIHAGRPTSSGKSTSQEKSGTPVTVVRGVVL